MRLPKDPENWTGLHAEQAIDKALKLFAEYEAKADLDNLELTERLYNRYFSAREEAVNIARYTHWCYKEAEMLP